MANVLQTADLRDQGILVELKLPSRRSRCATDPSLGWPMTWAPRRHELGGRS
jgi:hypothetical protein